VGKHASFSARTQLRAAKLVEGFLAQLVVLKPLESIGDDSRRAVAKRHHDDHWSDYVGDQAVEDDVGLADSRRHHP